MAHKSLRKDYCNLLYANCRQHKFKLHTSNYITIKTIHVTLVGFFRGFETTLLGLPGLWVKFQTLKPGKHSKTVPNRQNITRGTWSNHINISLEQDPFGSQNKPGGKSASPVSRKKFPRDKKAEQLAKEAVDYAKKNGVCSVHVPVAPLFIGKLIVVPCS